MASSDSPRDSAASSLYHLERSDPRSELIDRSALDPDDVAEISEVMAALGRLRDAEQELSEASLRYMRLGRTDMQALHYLIVAENTGAIATPSGIAAHLKISSASTTKLLDRLQRAGHIRRATHPSDRRALAISITSETREAAMQSVGRQQAKRFHAAARLTSAERRTVIRFLDDMTSEITLRDEGWANPEHA